VAKKFNKGRKQKKNIDKMKLEKYREEIARELGVELPGNRKSNEFEPLKDRKSTFTFNDDAPLL